MEPTVAQIHKPTCGIGNGDTVAPWPVLVNGKPLDRAAFSEKDLHVTG